MELFLKPYSTQSHTSFATRYRVSTLLSALLVLMVVLLIANNLMTARQARQVLFDETTNGLQAQVKSLSDMLNTLRQN